MTTKTWDSPSRGRQVRGPDLRPGRFLGNLATRRFDVLATVAGLTLYSIGVSVRQDSLVVVGGLVLAITALRLPFLGPLDILILSAIYGRIGAHGGAASLGVPVFEMVLVSSCVGTAFWLASKSSLLRSPQFNNALAWVPAAVWGMALILSSGQSDLLSRVREAMIFVYPGMIAFPLLTLDLRRTRYVERFIPSLFIGLGWLVLLAGVYNVIVDTAMVTNTGQNRYLSGFSALPLVGSFYAAVFQYRSGRWALRATIVGALPVAGLLLVNHRSAFIGLAISIIVFASSQAKRPWMSVMRSRRRDSRLATALVAMTILLLLTPVGQAGIDRALAVDPDDANIAYRLAKSQEILSAEGYTLMTGEGVGLVETTALDLSVEVDRGDAHNSYATIIQRGGIFGLALIAVPLGGALRRMWRMPMDLVGVLLGLAVFGLVMAAGNVVLESSYFGIWIWAPLMLGVKMAAIRRAKTSGRTIE